MFGAKIWHRDASCLILLTSNGYNGIAAKIFELTGSKYTDIVTMKTQKSNVDMWTDLRNEINVKSELCNLSDS